MKSMSRDGLAAKGLFQISDANTFCSSVLDCKIVLLYCILTVLDCKIVHNVRFGVKG